ncbi:uncharacterized protein LOC108735894 [Agrilus planipennis]|uniref:Gustatory receptor n=1 Tax=Agrilus planipennis TaxID=224129 RepID=A0A1W4WU97_AGRPL|nr:uncharacterized protein LOC108735894 [Agrilus planipennis]
MVVCSRLSLLFSDGKQLMKVFNLLQEVDVVLPSASSTLKEDARKMKLIFFVILVLPLPFHLYSLMYNSDGSLMSILNYVVVRFNNTGFGLTECQFLCLCNLVYTRFKVINKSLRSLTLMTKGDDILLNSNAGVNCNRISNVIDELHLTGASNYPPGYNSVRNCSSSNIAAEDIQKLKLAHVRLTKALTNLNLYYSPNLLSSTFAYIFFVLFCLYYSVYSNYQLSASDINNLQLFNSTLWMVLVLMKFFLACFVANYVTDEGNTTKILISRFIHRGLPTATKQELINFFEYAIEREEKLTICGIFILDHSLLAKAVVTGITFLILLIQFRSI